MNASQASTYAIVGSCGASAVFTELRARRFASRQAARSAAAPAEYRQYLWRQLASGGRMRSPASVVKPSVTVRSAAQPLAQHATLRGMPATGALDITETRSLRSREYHCAMGIATGTVVEGKVQVDGVTLPEGATVTVLTRGPGRGVLLTPEEEAELLESLAQAERGETISPEELFARLERNAKQ